MFFVENLFFFYILYCLCKEFYRMVVGAYTMLNSDSDYHKSLPTGFWFGVYSTCCLICFVAILYINELHSLKLEKTFSEKKIEVKTEIP